MSPEELREKVARNICVQLYGRTWGDTKPPRRAVCFDVADTALCVIREAMREPTKAMEDAAPSRPHSYPPEDRTMYPSIWRAMQAAFWKEPGA